jgi:hypothetical protein
MPGIRKTEEHIVSDLDSALHMLRHAFACRTYHILTPKEVTGLRCFIKGSIDIVEPEVIGFFTPGDNYWYTWSIFSEEYVLACPQTLELKRHEVKRLFIGFNMPIRALTIDECYIRAVIVIGTNFLQQLHDRLIDPGHKLNPITVHENVELCSRKIDFAYSILPPHVYYTN